MELTVFLSIALSLVAAVFVVAYWPMPAGRKAGSGVSGKTRLDEQHSSAPVQSNLPLIGAVLAIIAGLVGAVLSHNS